MSVAQIVISTAPHESHTLAFNYASLALNNSFFLHHLVSPRFRTRLVIVFNNQYVLCNTTTSCVWGK